MATLREWIVRLWGTLRPGRSDRDLERELRVHLEIAADAERQHGHSPESAAGAVAIGAGGVAQAMEALRDQRGLPWFDDLLRDLRHACRLLRRHPAFTAVAVISLALGIGANSAIFSLADELILRPLPVRDPESVVTVSADTRDQESEGGGMSYPNYRDLRQVSHAFDGLLAYQISSVSFARARETIREMHRGALVSDDFFDLLGVRPALGRTFRPDEGRVPGRDAVVVLSYDFWKNTLAADASIVNATVWMNGIDFHVIGVAAEDFTGPEPPLRPAFYLPLMMAQRLGGTVEDPLEKREARLCSVMGRLKPGISRQRAQAELTTVWQVLEQQYPNANRNRTIAVRTDLEERLLQDPQDAVLLAILAALAAIVLTIACANVANLMLGRGRARSREVAIRLALGVSRPRLLRQLMTESLLLAGMGLALGLGIAYSGIRFLQTIPTADQVVIAPRLDQRVFVFGLVVAAVSAILVGLAPARQSLKTDLVPGLKTTELGEATPKRAVGRNLLVMAQIALSMVLLVATGMLIDGFRKALVLDPGFRPDHLIMMSADTSLVRYTPLQTHRFYRDLVDRARAIPGVTSAALTSSVPFKVGDQRLAAVVPEGYQLPNGQDHVSSAMAVVDETFFGAMQIAIVRGRAFTPGDNGDAPRVGIVNQEFARRYWPNADPIGQRLRLSDGPGARIEVVGVAKTGKYWWIGETPKPFLYLPFAQQERPRMTLLVEATNADAAFLAAPLRGVAATLDVNVPVLDVQTYSSLYRDRAIAVPLMIMQIVVTMGLLGLTLTLIGLYALIVYSVARRTREIGIRMAIGAGKSDVLKMVLRQGLMLSIGGIAVGGVVSVAVARLLTATLAGVGTPNPATYVIVPAGLLCLTVAASFFPARRASLVDPLLALRYE
ncbi:MAG TPA: ABC transporter permease [Vicinamibacterales bacterium]|nr:ABC transporter permease [Vicinamibacterales bacterium]